ncbi:hypothetical protein RRG08_058965 [Elysia crispata]|uniref:Fibrinogen C-terminal domain-containing protein n=1 Tax=Elysia crispata TaxID=231223 RepID=A0AAE1DF26_9GAST|nr:hypothetical protein RRG08_058965 [Elysia crispata]
MLVTLPTNMSSIVRVRCRGNMDPDPVNTRKRIYEPFIGKHVLCDTHNGWLYIQRRVTGKENFFCSWVGYARGFGDVGNDHWLGLDAIHLLTRSVSYNTPNFLHQNFFCK